MSYMEDIYQGEDLGKSKQALQFKHDFLWRLLRHSHIDIVYLQMH